MSLVTPPQFDALRINAAPIVYHCDPHWNWAPPPLFDHDFWYVVSGQGTLTVRGREHALFAGQCFVLRPGDTPRGAQDPHHRLTVFFAHFDVLDEAGQVGPPLTLPGPVTVQGGAFLSASAHHMERLWQRGDVFARQQAEQVLGVLLWQVWDESQFPASPAAAFETLTAAIRREPGKRWTLDGMAQDVSLSRAQFTRRFRAMQGTSPVRFVIQARLERARQLLTETDMTLEHIAGALGYSDAFFFARQFKQFTGQTPGTVRRRKNLPQREGPFLRDA